MSREGLGLEPAERLDTKVTLPVEQRKWDEGSCQGWRASSSLGVSSLGPLTRVSPAKGGDRDLGFPLEPLRPASCSKNLLRPGRVRIKQGLCLSLLVREPTSVAREFPRP